jgi:peptidoglycan/LPS O-acetylase OafA/YrhL
MVSSLLLRVSTFLLLCGLIFGITMGIKQDFTLAPAHAHLNLVGFVLMFAAGLYYRVVPKAELGLLPKIHAGLHILGALVFPLGIALVLTGGPERYEVFTIAGSLIVLAAVALFTLIVFRTAAI